MNGITLSTYRSKIFLIFFNQTEILSNTICKHPVIILAGILAEDIKTIIYFIYHGELENITYDRFISVLKTAEMLKICGLTEVIDHIPPRKCLEDLEEIIMMDDGVNESTFCNPPRQGGNSMEVGLSKTSEEDIEKKPKPKKHQRKYSEGSLGWALSDMEKGMSLVEAARLHKIPRSTLYAKAKQHSGLRIASRKEHTNQDCQAAVQAIAGGLSLKRAAEQYGIPKTVLWRRVQKRIDICSNLKSRRKKQERGLKLEENKTCILQDGKLTTQNRIIGPTVRANRMKSVEMEVLGGKDSKQYRLAQALNACKEGKMSQAVASRTYQVPKTLIWRRLQKAWSINQNETGSKSIDSTENKQISTDETAKENNISYIGVLSNVDSFNNEEEKSDDHKYVEAVKDEQFTEAPFIILASANDVLPKQEIVNDEELIESLNVRIENVVEVVSDKDEIHWRLES
ncbi:uncharacterized protein isoform X2 [Rhodnius prolixus]|uniref:uncharacterized protein isoform X2 n=1 Tax=Rhodnius prolixus TaxID=13249 RepID=UPI003D18E73F